MFERLQPVTKPDPADAGRGDVVPPLAELVAHSYPAERRLLEREADDRLFDLRRRPIPQIRLPAGLLEQGFDAALFDRLLVPVERVAGVAHDLAGLRHVAELLGQPQQANLVFDHGSMCTHPRGSPPEHPAPVVLVHNQGTPLLLPPKKCQITSQLLQFRSSSTPAGERIRISRHGSSVSRSLSPVAMASAPALNAAAIT